MGAFFVDCLSRYRGIEVSVKWGAGSAASQGLHGGEEGSFEGLLFPPQLL